MARSELQTTQLLPTYFSALCEPGFRDDNIVYLISVTPMITSITEVDMSSPSQPVMASRTDHVKKSLPTVEPPMSATTVSHASITKQRQQVDTLDQVSNIPTVDSRLCRYTVGVWSSCSPNTRSRTRERILQPGSPELCDVRVVEAKPCFTRSGKGIAIAYINVCTCSMVHCGICSHCCAFAMECMCQVSRSGTIFRWP